MKIKGFELGKLRVPLKTPLLGPVTIEKVSASPSVSLAVRVMAMGVSRSMSTAWSWATGASLTVIETVAMLES